MSYSHGRTAIPRRVRLHIARRASVLGRSIFALIPLLSNSPQAPAVADRPPIEQVLRQLREKYKDNDKKYAALIAKVDKAVRKALASTPFPGSSPESPRFLEKHPYLALVNELSAPLRAKPAKAAAPASCAILARFPWSERLDLLEGLEYGSDRPIPTHESGFIDLGDLPELGPGLPEPCVNQYLFGLQEVVGWRSCVVEGKKQLAFRARTPKDPPPAIEAELQPWEALRVYLRGSLPEVSLFAIPRLTHLIHARLAERRGTDGKAAPMDELLALLDAHWNGFSFRTPYTKTRTIIALPIFSLIADHKGFVYRFPTGEHLSTTGDLPFVSDLTLKRYALAFRGESLEVHDFVAQTPQGTGARNAFWADCVHLSRYRALLDLFVRAILEPGSALPAYIADCDFAEGRPLSERKTYNALDVPRKHALVLWARAAKDPVELANLLYDQVLSLEVNRFPKNASLQSELAYFVRKHDEQFLSDIQAHVARERSAAEAASDFEREFSPNEKYLDPTSTADTDYLAHSYQTFHAVVSDTIRDAAYAVVLAEVGGR